MFGACPLFRLGQTALGTRRRWPPNPLYVDTSASPGGSGAIDDPVDTLATALAMVTGLPDYTIRVRTPSGPIRASFVHNSTFALTIEGWDDEKWQVSGGDLVTGWIDQGGGVWKSPPLGWTAMTHGVVLDLTETFGGIEFPVKLIDGGATTTPAEGEVGYVGGAAYVHLPDGADPNAHQIELARRNYGFQTYGSGRLTLRDLDVRTCLAVGALNGLSTQPAGTGFMRVEDSVARFCATAGWAAAGVNEETVFVRAESYRNTNDGFGHHNTGGAALMVLNGCIGSYNGDRADQSSQGCSNHDTTTMIVNGGRFDGNVSGGMVVVGQGRCDIHGDTIWGAVVMDGNMRLGITDPTIAAQAGCAWLETSTGTVTASEAGPVIVSNGLGVGVKVATSASVTGADLITSTGNALPDEGV